MPLHPDQLAVAVRIVDIADGIGAAFDLSLIHISRIAGAFGLDTTTRANIMSAVYTAQAAVNTTRTVVQAVAK